MLLLLGAALLSPGAGPPSADRAAEKAARAATVRVHNRTRDVVGSGVVIARVGAVVYVLTAAHVVDGGTRVTIDVADSARPGGRRSLGEAAVEKAAAAEDLALLRVALADGAPAALPAALPAVLPVAKAAPRDLPCPAVSAADDGNGAVVAAETIAAAPLLKRPGADVAARFWKCRAAPVPGRSGGPLLDEAGALLGICSGGTNGDSYYTHLDEIRRFLKGSGLGFLAR